MPLKVAPTHRWAQKCIQRHVHVQSEDSAPYMELTPCVIMGTHLSHVGVSLTYSVIATMPRVSQVGSNLETRPLFREVFQRD